MALLGELTIDLNVVSNNWQALSEHVAFDKGANQKGVSRKARVQKACECAAVVKANAYGLGVKPVALALYQKGCRTFFVANIREAAELSDILPLSRIIYTLQGFDGEELEAFAQNNIRPVIVSLGMLNQWIGFEHPNKPLCAVKVNTGMNRLGLDVEEFEAFIADSQKVKSSRVELVLSHLACADDRSHPNNKKQLECFKSLIRSCETRGYCGGTIEDSLVGSGFEEDQDDPIRFRFSLANSAAVCLGSEYAFDLVRPGIALYSGTLGSTSIAQNFGVNNPVSLRLPIIQIRAVSAGEAVGYDSSYTLKSDSVIAIVAGGYADGIFRYVSNAGHCYFRGYAVPIIGRVSMDSFAIDITGVADVVSLESGDLSGRQVDASEDLTLREMVCVFSSVDSLLELARSSGTITYEVLTSLGDRYRRVYY